MNRLLRVKFLRPIWVVIFFVIFVFGFLFFQLTGRTTKIAYVSMRKLFVLTNGRFNDWMSTALGRDFHLNETVSSKVFGTLSKSEIDDITNKIENNGYYVFRTKLDQITLDQLYSFAKDTPARQLIVSENRYSETPVLVDHTTPESPRYDYYMKDLFENETLVSLITDEVLFSIAGRYLKRNPVLDLAAMWWSFPFEGKGAAEAAQMYHFDMDRIKFLKFFFYLTDVDEHTGPHCYVSGSHKRKPQSILQDRRITDEEISQNYSTEDILELVGDKGSILAVDTRGFHKGKVLSKDKRLLFQIEFTNSMFGQSYPKIPLIPSIKNKLNEALQKHPGTYDQILTQ